MLLKLSLSLSTLWVTPARAADAATDGGAEDLGEMLPLRGEWYTFTEPRGDFDKEYQEAGVTWVYDGMADFHRSRGGVGQGSWHNTADLPASMGNAQERVQATARVDDLGRRWIAASVQRVDILDALYAAADRMAEEIGFRSDGDILAGVDGYELTEDELNGADVWGTPTFWSFDDHLCGGSESDEPRHSYGSDYNSTVSDPMSTDERKTVSLFVDTDHDGVIDSGCSGSLVSRRWALTAAHCLVDDPHDPSGEVLPRDVIVCSYGNHQSNADCTAGSIIQLGPDYLAAPGEATDYGLLKIVRELNPSIDLGYRAISSATASTIEASTVYLHGAPSLAPAGGDACADNSTGMEVDEVTSGGVDFTMPFPFEVRAESSSSVHMTSSQITNEMDLGHGWSGGGYWYVASGGGDYTVGIQSEFITFADWGSTSWGEFSGPKNLTFRSWVYATI